MSRKYFLTGFIMLLLLNACKKEETVYQLKPIGYFISDYTPSTGAPRQGRLVPENHAQIVLNKTFVDGLHELDEFEYIIVLYWFDKVQSWEPDVNPPESEHEFGVFATRSPKRPNPIGFSVVKLDSIRGNILYLSGIDAFNKTPIIDIKPYLPSVDIIQSKKNEAAEVELGHHDEKYIKDSIFWK